jgi:hypothetical protein
MISTAWASAEGQIVRVGRPWTFMQGGEFVGFARTLSTER